MRTYMYILSDLYERKKDFKRESESQIKRGIKNINNFLEIGR